VLRASPLVAAAAAPLQIRSCASFVVAVTEAEIKRLFRKFKKLDVDKSGQ